MKSDSLTRIKEALMCAPEEGFEYLGFTKEDLSDLVYRLKNMEDGIEDVIKMLREDK